MPGTLPRGDRDHSPDGLVRTCSRPARLPYALTGRHRGIAEAAGGPGAQAALITQVVPRQAAASAVHAPDLGAGERDRTADLPFTRRLLCLLSYTGGETLCIVAGLCGGKMSRLSRANAVSVSLTHPVVVSADLTRQVLVSLQGNGRVSCRCMRASDLLPIPP